jgi:hypothetical protein
MPRKFVIKIVLDQSTYENLVVLRGMEKTWQQFFEEMISDLIKEFKATLKTSEQLAKKTETKKEIEIKTAEQVLMEKKTEEKKEGKKEAKPTKEEFRIKFKNEEVKVANVLRGENYVEYIPTIPVDQRLYLWLQEQASVKGIKTTAEISDDLKTVEKITVYENPNLAKDEKEAFQKQIVWVFRTAYEKLSS